VLPVVWRFVQLNRRILVDHFMECIAAGRIPPQQRSYRERR
jgi:hypothetical protein